MVKKIFMIALGTILVILGAIGVVFPILPTVPFWLAASFCLVRGSGRINTWFCNTKMYKKHVGRFVEQRGLTLRAKLYILIPVYIILGTLCVIYDILIMRITIIILLIIKTIVFVNIKTIKEVPKDTEKLGNAEDNKAH